MTKGRESSAARIRRRVLLVLLSEVVLDGIVVGIFVWYWIADGQWSAFWGRFISGGLMGVVIKRLYYGWRHFATQDADRP